MSNLRDTLEFLAAQAEDVAITDIRQARGATYERAFLQLTEAAQRGARDLILGEISIPSRRIRRALGEKLHDLGLDVEINDRAVRISWEQKPDTTREDNTP